MNILRFGSTGQMVRRWQAFLNTQGESLGVDGKFGRDTLDATVRFQADNGLVSDGIVGNDTYLEAARHGFVLVEPDPTPDPSSTKVAVRTTSRDNVTIYKFASGEAVFFTANMAVDADGCPQAYHPGNTGIEDIRNSGGLQDNIVVFVNGAPYVQVATDPAPGYYVSMTSWENPSTSVPKKDPRKYLDALKVSYIVVPGGAVGGATKGNAAMVIDLTNGKKFNAVVGDIGPTSSAGEASMQMCGLVSGLNPSQITETLARKSGSVINPRNGGPSGNRYRYIAFPGVFIPWGSTQAQVDAIVSAAWGRLTDAQRQVLST